MKKYKVLKECVVDSRYYKAGDIYKTMNCARGGYMGQLINHGFIEELGEAPKTVCDLKHGEDYLVITERGRIEQRIYWYDRSLDEAREIDNVFLTEEEAKTEIARRKAKVILERDTKGFKPDWSNNLSKYEVYYDYFEDKLSIGSYRSSVAHRDLWFATEEDAEESISHHEKEWKTYLGVEE